MRISQRIIRTDSGRRRFIDVIEGELYEVAPSRPGHERHRGRLCRVEQITCGPPSPARKARVCYLDTGRVGMLPLADLTDIAPTQGMSAS
jgi:hypothetical protein